MRSLVFVASLWQIGVLLLLTTQTEAAKCPRVCVCDNKKLTVACVRKNLTEIPLNIDELTVKLELRRNNLQVLSKGSFQNTPYLTHLNLQACGLRSVQEGAFRGLSRLVQLDLTNNDIEVVHQESFDGLSSLKQLLLDRNRIEEIRPGAFVQLGSLNLLSLTQNRLVYIPNMAFQGLLSLGWLRLSNNALSNLAMEAFTGLLALTRLSLDHNELQFFPTLTMSRLVEVTHLEMGSNPVTYLGDESVSMPKLTHLHLDSMSLQDLSDTALDLAPHLTHLDLSQNQLRYLAPPQGGKVLRQLNLTGNPLMCSCSLQPLRTWALAGGVQLLGACSAPPHLAQEPLEAVEVQDLRCRGGREMEEEEKEAEKEEEMMMMIMMTTAKPKKKVKCPENCKCEPDAQHATCEERGHTKVPRGFPSNTLLLDMRGNHFHYLPSNSFPGTAKVVSLRLDHCEINEIEAGAFQGMRGLMYLYLSENKLSFLGPDTFVGAPDILYLHLEGNKLSQFPSAAVLAHIPSLLELHLERNLIARLEPAGLLSPITSLTGLFLTNNVIDTMATGAIDPAPRLDVLHLGANKLTEMPSHAIGHAPKLSELRLSGNLIRWVGSGAFRPVARSLKRLYLDSMGLERMSEGSLAGLGSVLQDLRLEGNQLEWLPELSPLSGLELLTLTHNPLLCDCNLLHLRRWLERTNLTVTASCFYPPELRGQSVMEVDTFKNCPDEKSDTSRKQTKSSKSTKLKPGMLEAGKVKPLKAGAKVKANGKSKSKAKDNPSVTKPGAVKGKLDATLSNTKPKRQKHLRPTRAPKTSMRNRKTQQ